MHRDVLVEDVAVDVRERARARVAQHRLHQQAPEARPLGAARDADRELGAVAIAHEAHAAQQRAVRRFGDERHLLAGHGADDASSGTMAASRPPLLRAPRGHAPSTGAAVKKLYQDASRTRASGWRHDSPGLNA